MTPKWQKLWKTSESYLCASMVKKPNLNLLQNISINIVFIISMIIVINHWDYYNYKCIVVTGQERMEKTYQLCIIQKCFENKTRT